MPKVQYDAHRLSKPWPLLGCGVGLRTEHYETILRDWPAIDWFEAVTENFMDSGGKPLWILEKIREHYPVALHGVSLSLGSTDPINRDYLKNLKELERRIQPEIISDHLSWSGISGENLYDLYPLPHTIEAIKHVVSRIEEVQDLLRMRILIENPSSYVTFQQSIMPEWDFIVEIARRSGCGILLDLNNVFVNSVNHNFDPYEYIDHIPGDMVGQFHLAGHTDMGKFLFDTHSGEVIDKVWELYQYALKKWGAVATLIEWDEKIPEWQRLASEADKAKIYYNNLTHGVRLKDELKPNQTSAAHNISSDTDIALSELQRWFREKVKPFTPQTSTNTTSPLNPQGGDPGIERLKIYASGYLIRMREALEESYEATKHIVGAKKFSDLAEAYAKTYPSRHYNLSNSGDKFPQLLKDHPLGEELPFLYDLARLEWKIVTSFHSFDIDEVEPDIFQKIKEEDFAKLVFSLKRSTDIIQSSWPILDLWQARQTPRDQIKINLENKAQNILIYRDNFQIKCQPISKEYYAFFNAILKKAPLGKICEELEKDFSDSLPISEWFQEINQKKLIEKIDTISF